MAEEVKSAGRTDSLAVFTVKIVFLQVFTVRFFNAVDLKARFHIGQIGVQLFADKVQIVDGFLLFRKLAAQFLIFVRQSLKRFHRI